MDVVGDTESTLFASLLEVVSLWESRANGSALFFCPHNHSVQHWAQQLLSGNAHSCFALNKTLFLIFQPLQSKEYGTSLTSQLVDKWLLYRGRHQLQQLFSLSVNLTIISKIHFSSSDCFFCPNNIPKYKDPPFTVIKVKEKQQMLTFKRRKLFVWKLNETIDYPNSWQLIFFWSTNWLVF